jgi:hypothetical protein
MGMANVAVCDLCGDKDDWSTGGPPFLWDGLILQVRGNDGSDEIVATLDLCSVCKEKLFKLCPDLARAVKVRSQ